MAMFDYICQINILKILLMCKLHTCMCRCITTSINYINRYVREKSIRFLSLRFDLTVLFDSFIVRLFGLGVIIRSKNVLYRYYLSNFSYVIQFLLKKTQAVFYSFHIETTAFTKKKYYLHLRDHIYFQTILFSSVLSSSIHGTYKYQNR